MKDLVVWEHETLHEADYNESGWYWTLNGEQCEPAFGPFSCEDSIKAYRTVVR
jgi:hypothetical protein